MAMLYIIFAVSAVMLALAKYAGVPYRYGLYAIVIAACIGVGYASPSGRPQLLSDTQHVTLVAFASAVVFFAECGYRQFLKDLREERKSRERE